MKIFYDSKRAEYKTPFGCIRQEEPCTLHIKIPREVETNEVCVVLECDSGRFYKNFEMLKVSEDLDFKIFETTFSISDCALYFYYFQVNNPTNSFNICKDGARDTTITGHDKWQITCFNKDYDTPESFKGRVMYQIFPDRFYADGICETTGKLEPFFIHENSKDIPVYYPDYNGIVQNNDFYGGNLKGITAKLPYLQMLGVSILYLNPIFKAYSNHRYDTADYMKVDPLLGTEEDFINLCGKAHEFGMKVILDGVFSHTGCNSVYFDKYNVFGNGAFLNPTSPYRSWYQFHSESSQEYTSWWGIETLPCTEELNPNFMDFIISGEDSVVAHWLNCGVDGYRLDVADELPDEFIALLHAKVKEIKPDAVVIGEVWEDASNKISYSVRRKYFTNTELDSVMNYPYKDAIIGFLRGDQNAIALGDTVMTLAENYPKPVLDCLMNILGTHDTMRILTVLGTTDFSLNRDAKAHSFLNDPQLKLASERLKAAAFLQFMLPGCPCIYYGDEAGSQGFEDPLNRRYFPWGSMNIDLHEFYTELGRIKNEYEALRTGSVTVLSQHKRTFIFERKLGNKRLIAFVNLRDQYECFTEHKVIMMSGGTIENGMIELNKYGFLLLEAEAK